MEHLWEYLRSSSSVNILIDTGIELGLQPIQLLSGTGLKLDQVNDANSVISPQQELQVIGNLIKLVRDPIGLGLIVGLKHQLTTYGIMGYAMMSSATGSEALALAKELLPLTFTFVRISARASNGHLTIYFEQVADIAPPLQQFVIERAMAATSRVIGDILGNSFSLLNFFMACAPHQNSQLPVPQSMWGADIQFNAEADSFSFSLKGLQQPLPHANPMTAAMCKQLCLELLEKRRTKLTTSVLITELLKSNTSHPFPMLADLANMLHVSERTLKRKLQLEDTSFSEILGQVKLEKAERLMAGDSSLTQIAADLGFSDLSTFSQAYKRWTGVSPSEKRKKLRVG